MWTLLPTFQRERKPSADDFGMRPWQLPRVLRQNGSPRKSKLRKYTLFPMPSPNSSACSKSRPHHATAHRFTNNGRTIRKQRGKKVFPYNGLGCKQLQETLVTVEQATLQRARELYESVPILKSLGDRLSRLADEMIADLDKEYSDFDISKEKSKFKMIKLPDAAL
jgi:hypothetical protein